MKHSAALIERSETQDACGLGETVSGFAPLNPPTRQQSRIPRHAILRVGPGSARAALALND
jgi:hypothetical protein